MVIADWWQAAACRNADAELFFPISATRLKTIRPAPSRRHRVGHLATRPGAETSSLSS